MNCWYSLEGRNIRITGGAGYLSAETGDAAALPKVLERLLAEHGVPNVLVHLVTAFSPGKRLEVFSPREFGHTFDPALTPSFILSRTLAARMKVRRSDSNILFSSMYGVVALAEGHYHDSMAPNPIAYGRESGRLRCSCRVTSPCSTARSVCG